MALKALGSFLNNKMLYPYWTMQTTDVRPLMDPNNKNVRVGTRLELAIIKDDVNYPPRADGRTVTNLFEKINVKVMKDIDIPVGSIVELVNPRGKLYGDFCGQLSTTADDVKVVQPSNKP